MEIKDALAHLDPLDDDQWTTEGLPKVDAVEKILGKSVSRADITNADPSFNRESAGSVPDDSVSTDEPAETPDAEETEKEEPQVEMDPIDRKEAELQAEIEDLSLLASQKIKELDILKKQVTELSHLQNVKNNMLTRLRRARPNRADHTAIGAYLARAAKTREERAARALSFIAGGTNLSDVLAQLQIKSPIDLAMNKRKPALGSTRPAMGIPVRR
jgi:hypothetical protein